MNAGLHLIFCADVKSKPSISIVGPGSLGTSLAIALAEAGYLLKEVVYRSDKRRALKVARGTSSKAVQFNSAGFETDIVWICVSDREIATTAVLLRERTSWAGKIVFHSSGALSSDELTSLRKAGASVAAVHPMMSFVRGVEGSFRDVTFALEGDPKAVRVAAAIAKDLGGTSLKLRRQDKALYHALGAFASPLIVAHLAGAERIGRELGLNAKRTRGLIGPILLSTIRNYLAHGPEAAFSGPIARGDVETVRRNLESLKKVRGAREIYRVLAKVAVEDLKVKETVALKKLLD